MKNYSAFKQSKRDTYTQGNKLNLSLQEAFTQLNTSEEGLTFQEAENRYLFYGPNILTQKRTFPLSVFAFLKAINPLTIILLAATAVSLIAGNVINAYIIFAIVTISIFLSYFQTHRSLRTAQKLQAHVAVTATVLRDKKWENITTDKIVPGDVIRLEAGDIVPADSLLITAKDLHAQQSILTGESFPVEKEVLQEPNNQEKIDSIFTAKNVVFAGTSIISGTATALCVRTGKNTAIGHIAKNISSGTFATSFEKDLASFSFFITQLIFFLTLSIFVLSAYFKRTLMETLLFSIAIAVGLTPEFLPMLTTIILARGSLAMAKHHVIVKNLSAIQNFGSIDVLCMDKTGTLTQGKMVLEQTLNTVGNSAHEVLYWAYLNSVFETTFANPLTQAILEKAKEIYSEELNSKGLLSSILKIDEIPFESYRRCSSIILQKEEKSYLITKGAAESILDICTSYLVAKEKLCFSPDIKEQCKTLFTKLSQQGYRVLTIAYKEIATKENYTISDETELMLVGFLCFSDPIIPNLPSFINGVQQAGVTLKIITGDNQWVTQHVCQQANLKVEKILTGSDLEHVHSNELIQYVEPTTIFSRVSPEQKQQIVECLRKKGHVVGYIGDGVNDVLALQSADVGISVANAVDVARESSHIILLKPHLHVLLNGILEGRKAFGNVMKYLLMSISSNFGNIISMVFAITFLPFLPMLPSQILLNNLLYDLAQVAIPTDRVDSFFLRKPRRWNITIIKHFMFYIGPLSSAFDLITFYILLNVFNASEELFHTAWFVESLATQTLVIFIIRTMKNPFKFRPSFYLLFTALSITMLGFILPFSPVNKMLGFEPLPFVYVLFIFLMVIFYLGLVQLIKRRLMFNWLQ